MKYVVQEPGGAGGENDVLPSAWRKQDGSVSWEISRKAAAGNRSTQYANEKPDHAAPKEEHFW